MQMLPRLLADFPRLPGLIKCHYSDFIVEEIPLYLADGQGTHTYFLVEKVGLTTFQAVQELALALNVPRHAIGIAGLKDARALTRQWMSIEHVEPDRLAGLRLPRIQVREVTRHRNKLRLGHLKGNSFTIRVRQSQPQRLPELERALAHLCTVGVPNYFGSQRFGYRGDTWQIGRAILRRQVDEAVDLILGKPAPKDHPRLRRARQLYECGQYAQAARLWPVLFRTERRALKALARCGGERLRAFAAIDRSTRSFYVSAYQSHLFNRVVARRLSAGLHVLWEGDLAWLHASGAVFRVQDPSREQPRADRFEISPTGPIFGYRMTTPQETAGRLEAELLAGEQLPADWARTRPLRVKGGRRPLRFQPGSPQVSVGSDDHGPYLELRFVLPRGSYATALLRELFELPEESTTDVETEEQAAEVSP